MNYTQNYQLPQWEKDDRIMMDDFNDAMSKVENGLGTIPRIITGSYTGNDEMSRKIDLGVTPRAVLVVRSDGAMKNSQACSGGLAVTGAPVVHGGTTMIAIVDGGFQLTRGYLNSGSYWSDANSSNFSYYYSAMV